MFDTGAVNNVNGNGHVNGNTDTKAMQVPPPAVTPVQMSPTFVEFIYKAVVPACFYAPLRQVDGDTTQLVVECISCLRTIQAVRGSDEMGAFLQTRFFPEHFAAYANASGFVSSLAKNEAKPLRAHYKSLEEMYKKPVAASK